MKFMRWIQRAFTVMALLSVEIPKAIEDGQITTAEIMILAKALFEVFGVTSFKLPESMTSEVIQVKVEKLLGK